jgi:hypothetical protein
MPKQGWEQILEPGPSSADGPALTASTTPTSILLAADKPQLYAGFWYVKKKIRVHAAGRVSNIITTPGTLTLDLRLGPADPPTIVVANGGAMSLNIVAKTNVPWRLTWDLTCQSIGNGTLAKLMHQGEWCSESVIGSGIPTATGAGTHLLPNAAPAQGTGFNSTVGLFMDLFATWSLSNANSIQVHQFHVEELN